MCEIILCDKYSCILFTITFRHKFLVREFVNCAYQFCICFILGLLMAEPTNSDKLFYKRLARHYLCDLMKEQRDVKLTCAAYHKETHILITGFSNGSFFVHELPEVNHIHSLRYRSLQLWW